MKNRFLNALLSDLTENDNGIFRLTLDDMSRQAATPAATLSAV